MLQTRRGDLPCDHRYMTSAPTVLDLNADLGEGIGDDEAMLALVTSANVACGGHAGDAATMRSVCARAAELGVRIGAHPSYPDRAGFGRTRQDVPERELTTEIFAQVSNLIEAAHAVGTTVGYLKPHGALYHTAAREEGPARAVVQVAVRTGLAVLGPPGALFLQLAQSSGLEAFTEGFADRGYTSGGTLVPRGQDGDVLTDTDQIAARVFALARTGAIAAVDGTPVPLAVRTLCVHGDTPHAVAITRRVREVLLAAGLSPRAFA